MSLRQRIRIRNQEEEEEEGRKARKGKAREIGSLREGARKRRNISKGKGIVIKAANKGKEGRGNTWEMIIKEGTPVEGRRAGFR